VLQGAGDAFRLGLRNHFKAHGRTARATNTIVLGIAPSAEGQPRWWASDGQLIPLRYFRPLRDLCNQIAAPRRGRGATPALPARSRHLPAIAIGASAPRSHQTSDTAENVDPRTLDQVVEFGLLLTDRIDDFLRTRTSDRGNRVALRRPLAVLGGGKREPSDHLGP
jgi:hypothetical protein